MQSDPSLSVVGLWRYPVKSMLGEELNSAEVTERGLVGDRQFAVVDRESGKIAGAKNPRKWGNFFDFRAAYSEPPRAGSAPPKRLSWVAGSNSGSGTSGSRSGMSGGASPTTSG